LEIKFIIEGIINLDSCEDDSSELKFPLGDIFLIGSIAFESKLKEREAGKILSLPQVAIFSFRRLYKNITLVNTLKRVFIGLFLVIFVKFKWYWLTISETFLKNRMKLL